MAGAGGRERGMSTAEADKKRKTMERTDQLQGLSKDRLSLTLAAEKEIDTEVALEETKKALEETKKALETMQSRAWQERDNAATLGAKLSQAADERDIYIEVACVVMERQLVEWQLRILIARHKEPSIQGQQAYKDKCAKKDLSTPTAMMRHWRDCPFRITPDPTNPTNKLTILTRYPEDSKTDAEAQFSGAEKDVGEEIDRLYGALSAPLHKAKKNLRPTQFGKRLTFVPLQSAEQNLAMLTFLKFYGVDFVMEVVDEDNQKGAAAAGSE